VLKKGRRFLLSSAPGYPQGRTTVTSSLPLFGRGTGKSGVSEGKRIDTADDVEKKESPASSANSVSGKKGRRSIKGGGKGVPHEGHRLDFFSLA